MKAVILYHMVLTGGSDKLDVYNMFFVLAQRIEPVFNQKGVCLKQLLLTGTSVFRQRRIFGDSSDDPAVIIKIKRHIFIFFHGILYFQPGVLNQHRGIAGKVQIDFSGILKKGKKGMIKL